MPDPTNDPTTKYVCAGSSVTLRVTTSDQDTYGDPVACDAAVPILSWSDSAGGSAGNQTSYSFQAPSAPGTYSVTCTARDGEHTHGQVGYDAETAITWTVHVVGISLTYPTDGQKVVGSNVAGGVRETRQFCLDMIARVEPDTIAPEAQVTFIYSKGSSQNTASGTRLAGTDDFVYTGWDIRQRFTTSSARYRIKARVSVAGITCESDEIMICIKKGVQATTVAADWVHYPYQWGSKGPNECSNVQNYGLPTDGYYNHEPYNNNHPAGSAHHYCCFDCSGLAWKCLSYVGVALPQGTAAMQYATFTDIGGNYKIGDLLFLGDAREGIHHVMISNSDGGGNPSFYEAPYTGAWTRASSGQTNYASGPSGSGWCMDDSCTH